MFRRPQGLFSFFYIVAVISGIYSASILAAGCAQIASPTGGTKDTIPPTLVSSNPENGARNFRGNRITLNFDEFVIVEQLQENLLVSPTPTVNPVIDYKLRSVTIRLRDTVQSNTTYVINLGNAIRDLNESNPVRNFRFVFSSGNVIDSLTLSGKVILAETGGVDSTMFVLLHRNLSDSAVLLRRPTFISRLNGNGEFKFENLPAGNFRLYALKDRDNGRTYNNLTEVFAFLDSPIVVSPASPSQTLYAYAERREVATGTGAARGGTRERFFRYTTKVPASEQDLTDPLLVTFNLPVVSFNPERIYLTDTFNVRLPNQVATLDTTRKIVSIQHAWRENTVYRLVVDKEVGRDTTGLTLAKTDTIRFTTKSAEDYGTVNLRFTNLPQTGNLVLQLIANNEVAFSAPLTGTTWTSRLFKPGTYTLRILIDENKNGVWDPGSFSGKKQPEKVIAVTQTISIRGNWDNELDVRL
jgi:hypothetical protein